MRKCKVQVFLCEMDDVLDTGAYKSAAQIVWSG